MRIVQRAWEAPSPTDFAAKTVRILWSDGSASTVKVPQTVENGQIRSWLERQHGRGRTVASWTPL